MAVYNLRYNQAAQSVFPHPEQPYRNYSAATGFSAGISLGLAYQAHRFAGMQVVLQALLSGNTLVVPSSADLPAMVQAFVEHRVNTLSATPPNGGTFIHGAIRGCSLEQITLGGEIADQAILSTLRREFPAARIVHIYASTEAGVGFSVTDGRAGFPAAWLGQGPPAS